MEKMSPSDLSFRDVDILTPEEKRFIERVNRSKKPFPAQVTIPDVIGAQADRKPDAVAVIEYDQRISYRNLENQASRMARLLVRCGILPGQLVAIYAQRSLQSVAAILGILKAGAGYVPVDPAYPEKRIEYILKDSASQVLVTEASRLNSISDTLSAGVKTIICLDACEKDQGDITLYDSRHIGEENGHYFQPLCKEEDLAYVIYTSGSTGNPKGVAVSHRAVLNTLFWLDDTFPLSPIDVVAQKTSLSFTDSVQELFWPLLKGSKLSIIRDEHIKDPARLLGWLRINKISITQFVPPLLTVFLEYLKEKKEKEPLPHLRWVFNGGEALPVHLAREWYGMFAFARLANIYGMTESAIYASYHILDKEPKKDQVRIPIGKPIANATVYTLDLDGQLCPPDIIGEICIGGIGLMDGYWRKPDLTDQAFTRHPVTGEQLYKTGDIGFLDRRGDFQYLGRLDHQVQLRGFRVELAEIEGKLINCGEIREAVVVLMENDRGDKYLSAYFVSSGQESVEHIKERLARELPDYMIPSFFVQLDKLPLTPNGKVDRKTLSSMVPEIVSGKEYAAPETEYERVIADLWKELLKLDKVGIDDNFFDVGGNSLVLIRLLGRLKEAVKTDLSVVELFQYPTIRTLADFLQRQVIMTPAVPGEAMDNKKAALRPGNLATGMDVAVIGMSGRFPGAGNLQEFWENLKRGIESICFFRDDEVEDSGINAPTYQKPGYVKAKGLLEDSDCFDAAFFGYTSREAEEMDPQMRILHQSAWEALEDAGYNPDRYPGKIGLYAGASPNPLWIEPYLGESVDLLEQFSALQSNVRDYLCTRLSYKLNLKGPAITVQTACSTSLVAIDLACQGVLSNRCDMALAGGVSVTFHDRAGYLHQEGMFLSPDGHCRAFADRAGGTVFGNGAGIVVLKRSAEAVSAGDHIYAVIKGAAVNNDGKEKVGYTAPGVEGQSGVIRSALACAGIEPETVNYIEAHGTGTTLGDPVEVEALKNAFRTSRQGCCALGSVKTNIGHLDAAAGIAGFIKVVLAIKHRQIPPSLHVERVNPRINFENSPFYVNGGLREWKGDGPLRAGVSSFGIGGTNAHVVLEEAPGPAGNKADSLSREYQLVVLSARSEAQLDRATAEVAAYLESEKAARLADVAYTLQVGRKGFDHRRMTVCGGAKEAAETLSALQSRKVYSHRAAETGKNIVFMYSGQGSQYVNMGLELYHKEAVFRREMDRCFDICRRMYSVDIKDILFPGHQANKAEKRIVDQDVSQPIFFIFEYALSKLLMHWGIKPHMLIGYSIGEYVAACLTDVFSPEEALKLVVFRGKLMHQLPGGVMLSVPLSEEELKPLLRDHAGLSLAVVNGPSCIVAGSHETIGAFEGELKRRKYLSMRLGISHAGHSWMMDSMLERFREQAEEVKFKAPRLPFISNITGTWISAAEAASPEYWTRHVRETVRFGDGIDTLVQEKNAVFLEVGPGGDLCALLSRHTDLEKDSLVINLVRQRRKRISDSRYLLNRLGQLWLHGIEIDWQAFHQGERRCRVSLPTYPFERQRYRRPAAAHRDLRTGSAPRSSLMTRNPDMAEWFYVPSWKQKPLPIPLKPEETAAEPAGWLIFSDPFGIGGELGDRLRSLDREVVLVEAGEEFARLDRHKFRIDSTDPDHYRRLMTILTEEGRRPGGILHLFSLTGNRRAPAPREDFQESQAGGYYSLIFLCRALPPVEGAGPVAQGDGSGKGNPLTVTVVTNQVWAVHHNDLIRPEKATVMGPCKTIPQEHRHILCRSIDIEPVRPGRRFRNRIVSQLLNECLVETRDITIAYRGRARWVQCFERFNLQGAPALPALLRPAGVYLITGGLGKDSLVRARYLAENVKARLVLTGRSFFPPPSQWDEWLNSHAAEDKTSIKINKIRELEELGAQVRVVRADVAGRDDMKRVMEQIDREFGELHGVIHAAGETGIESSIMISELGYEGSELHFGAKIYGLYVLQEVLAGRPIDFCLLTSSVFSIFGGGGVTAYTAASIFMVAFAYEQVRRYRRPWISMNWVEASAEETAEALGRILSVQPLPQVAVFPMDLPLVLEEMVQARFSPGPSTGDNVDDGEGTCRARSAMIMGEYVPPRGDIEGKLVKLWQHFLGIDRVGIEDDFFDLGGDSIRAISIINRINDEFKLKLSLAEFFNRPLVRSLAADIAGKVGGGLYPVVLPAEKREYYILSSAQRRLYVLHRLDPGNLGYNMPYVALLEGDIEMDRLKETFDDIIRRHDSLRTSFVLIRGEVLQKIHSHVVFDIEYFNLSGVGEAVSSEIPALNAELTALIAGFVRPFDLAAPPLWRLGLVKTGERQHILLLDLHHIITDGTSQDILAREFALLYSGAILENLKLSYKDFALWQNSGEQDRLIKSQESYWLDLYADDLPVLDLPADYRRPDMKSSEGDLVGFRLSEAETRKVKEIVTGEDVTLFILLLSILNILLARLSGQEDIVVGTAVTLRHHRELENIVGILLNTLAVRNYPSAERSFRPFLQEVKANTVAAFENQDYPFEDLVEKIKIRRDTGRHPLFDIMLVSRNFEMAAGPEIPTEETGLKLLPYPYENRATNFDITLYFKEEADCLSFSLFYWTKLFKPATIDTFVGYFKKILLGVSGDNMDVRLADIEIITPGEKRQLLHEFNDTGAELDDKKTVARLFDEQAARSPDRVALKYEDHQLCYVALKTATDHCRRRLAARGVTTGSVVGIVTRRSPWMMVGILGILKGGAAYLPIDPGYPPDRIRFMLADSGAGLLLSGARAFAESAQWSGVIDVIQLDEMHETPPSRFSPAPPAVEPAFTDLVYVIYTSGSTGRPKGAMIEHGSLVNRLNWMQKYYPLGADDTILQKTIFTFDVSVWELFWWFLPGAALSLLKSGDEKIPEAIAAAIEKSRVTVMHFVPSMLKTFLDYLETFGGAERLRSLGRVFASGEALEVPLAERFHRLMGQQPKETGLTNLYGPTEATVDVSYFDCPAGASLPKIPIGRPIDNTGLYILDRRCKLQPPRVAGELYIGGAGVGRGYLNNPELTAEKFVHGPLPGMDRLYRTGDLARWLPEGEIEFLGRLDHQVKIRGFRIELAEIETCLLRHPDIKAAVVVAGERAEGEKYLAAYIVSPTPEEIEENDVPSIMREYLSRRLPHYMIPAHFVTIDHIPLTSSGKLDRRALPEPVFSPHRQSAAPADALERSLIRIWGEVLGIEPENIGVDANFFELGGHSLAAVSMTYKIHRVLNLDISAVDIFRRSTVRSLSEHLRQKNRSRRIDIFPVEKRHYYPLSSAQQRLFFLCQLASAGTSYNMELVLKLEGTVDRGKLNTVFNELIRRHESLRTSFELVDDGPVQRVWEQVEVEIDFEETAGRRAAEFIKRFSAPHDLGKIPLLRVLIIKIVEGGHLLIVNIHHIISDEMSSRILLREFIALYNGEELPPLRLQYKDYASWQQGESWRRAVRMLEPYWLHVFQGDLPQLNLPTDFERTDQIDFEGKMIGFRMDDNHFGALNKLAVEEDVSLYILILTVFYVFLSRITFQGDIIVGTPVAGRGHEELAGVVGMFVNTVALRNYPGGGKRFTGFLKEVNENTLAALENQDYPFEDLVEKLCLTRDPGRNPLFDVMLGFQKMENREMATADFRASLYEDIEGTASKFDLGVNVIEAEGKLSLLFEYRVNLFREETIGRFFDYLKRICEAVAKDKDIKLEDIALPLDLYDTRTTFFSRESEFSF